MKVLDNMDSSRLAYLLPLFASAFAGSIGLVNLRAGEEFTVYLVISISMLVVAAAQYLEQRS